MGVRLFREWENSPSEELVKLQSEYEFNNVPLEPTLPIIPPIEK